MSLDVLNEDLQRSITSFLDRDSIKNLIRLDGQSSAVSHLGLDNYKKSLGWGHAAKTCKLYFDGPQNSTIFSIQSWLHYGSRTMPYVNTLDLFEYGFNIFGLREDFLLLGLKSIGLETRPTKHQLILRICEDIYNMKTVRAYLNTFYFKEIHFYGHSFDFHGLVFESFDMTDSVNTAKETSIETLVWKTKVLKCPCEVYAHLRFEGLEDLEIRLDYSRSAQAVERQSILKAFKEQGLKKLTTAGPFLDYFSMTQLDVCPSLESLSLVGYSNSYYEWDNAVALQKCCPSVRHFSIQYSNLVTKDLQCFDWTLWPLETLDLSFNNTLRHVEKWPVGLKELYIHDTGIELCSSWTPALIQQYSLQGLEILSTNAFASPEWAQFLGSSGPLKLTRLYLNMSHYLSGSQFDSTKAYLGGPWFWSALKNIEIFVRLKEAFSKEPILEAHAKEHGKRLRSWDY